MLDVDTLKDLYRHMEWADARLRELLYHLHVVQRAFLRTWRGEPRETPYPTFEHAAPLARWGRTYYGEAFAHLETLDDAHASEPMPLPWASMVEQRLGRAPDVTNVGETALQVALHSTYHRGQVNTRLKEVGGTPPLVDYIAWVWTGRPAADWSSVGAEGE